MEKSIVEYFDNHEGYRCGYCKSSNTFFSHGMWAHTMTPHDYQNLIDRGWRRSGKYCYKPTMNITCCPLYAIRCETKKFVLTKSQKKVLKKVHRFLAYGDKGKIGRASSSENMDDQEMEISKEIDVQNLKKIKNIHPIKQSDIETNESGSITDVPALDMNAEACSSTNLQSSQNSSQPTSILTDSSSHKSSNEYSNQPQCRKAKAIRQERKLQRLLKNGMSPESAAAAIKKTTNQPKSIEDFLAEPFPSGPTHKLELRLVGVETEQFATTLEESYGIYKKYQMVIHNDSEEDCNHDSFDNFLIETPLKRMDEEVSPERQVYGSFHQQYWLNNKLIAVGVLDILPFCVSSVYFYYDPDYSFLSLGTYAALREIALTRELNLQHSDLQYYYMGFYIHSCIKMRYKGQYVPSFLLCPETYTFHPIEKCRPKLDESKYSRLEENSTIEDTDGVVVLRDIIVLHNRRTMTYTTYNTKNSSSDEREVQEYAKFVGKKCYRRMLLYRG